MAGFPKGTSEKRLLAGGQDAVRARLKDPSGAQFRNVRMVAYADGRVICGEVNGRNSFGGYVGFSLFASDTVNAVLEIPTEYQIREQIAAMNAGLFEACR